MKLSYSPLPVGAEVIGWSLDLLEDKAAILSLRQALLRFHALVIRGHVLSPDDLVKAGHMFGHKLLTTGKDFWYSEEYPQIFKLTNEATQIQNCACEDWHCDGHYLQDPCGVTVTNMAAAAGGALSFCDLYSVFDSLDDKVRAALFQLRCSNSSGVIQPLVRRHPATGRTGLYTNMYSQVIAPNGQRLQPIEQNIKKLLDRFAYKHEWQTGDITILDNFAVTHKACPGSPDNLEVLQRVQTVASGTFWRPACAAAPKCNATPIPSPEGNGISRLLSNILSA